MQYFDVKACPFCGHLVGFLFGDGKRSCIVCEGCAAQGPIVPYPCFGLLGTPHEKAAEEAIKAWNKRTE